MEAQKKRMIYATSAYMMWGDPSALLEIDRRSSSRRNFSASHRLGIRFIHLFVLISRKY